MMYFFDKYDLQPEVPHWGFCEIAPSGWFPIPEAKRLVFGWFFAWWKRTLPIMKMIQESLKRRKQQNFSANINGLVYGLVFFGKSTGKSLVFTPTAFALCADPWDFLNVPRAKDFFRFLQGSAYAATLFLQMEFLGCKAILVGELPTAS